VRIYSSKTYIIVSRDLKDVDVVGGAALREKLRDSSLQDGDDIYEATLFAVAREKKQIELVDAAGQVQPVEMEIGDEPPQT